jgi:hypothetical protein
MVRAEIKHSKFTTNYTKVFCEVESEQVLSPHHFKVHNAKTDEVLGEVNFQVGPIKENGINGVNNEDLLLMIVCRLESFQHSDYACKENAEALEHLYAAVDALRARTNRRVNAGIEGTSALDSEG